MTYQQGLMWFVTHDERVPEAIRRRGRGVWPFADRFSRDRRLAASALCPRGAADGLGLRDDRGELPRQSGRRRFDRAGRIQHGLASLPAVRDRGSGFQETGRAAVDRPQRRRRAGSRAGAVPRRLSRRSSPSGRSARICSCRSACRRATSPTARSAWSRSLWCSVKAPARRPPWRSTPACRFNKSITPSSARDY